MNRKFVLESKFNKIVNLILYFLVLMFLFFVYLLLRFLNTGYTQYILITFSILISVCLIFYRENLVRIIGSMYINYKIKKLKKVGRKNLKFVINNLSNKSKSKKSLNSVKFNFRFFYEKFERFFRFNKGKKDYIEIK